LQYIRKNVKDEKNIILVEKAIGNYSGQVMFYIENLTGQNNSLDKEFNTFYQNRNSAFVNEIYSETVVDIVKLDDFIDTANIEPNFVKIDIEGAELNAIKGMLSYLREHKPILMVEITNNNIEIYNIMTDIGYVVFDEQFQVMKNGHVLSGNLFFLHPTVHFAKLKTMGFDIDKYNFDINRLGAI